MTPVRATCLLPRCFIWLVLLNRGGGGTKKYERLLRASSCKYLHLSKFVAACWRPSQGSDLWRLIMAHRRKVVRKHIYPCNNHRQTVYLLLKNLRFSVLDQTEQHNVLCGQSTRPIKWCGRLDMRSSVAPTPYPHIRSPRSRRCFSCGTKGRIILIESFSTPYFRA